jgi:hypothetical protein
VVQSGSTSVFFWFDDPDLQTLLTVWTRMRARRKGQQTRAMMTKGKPDDLGTPLHHCELLLA